MSKFKAVFGGVGKIFGGGSAGGGFLSKAATDAAARKKESEKTEVEKARKRTLEAAKLRTGRRKSILTSPRGVEDGLGVVQPKAGGTNRQAQLFGA